MGKITQNDRIIYQQQIRYYKARIDDHKKEINNLKIEITKNHDKEPLIKYRIANIILNSITCYCALNEISVHLLEVKNTAFLERARQLVYEVIINIEDIVTKFLDVPFSDYHDKVLTLDEITDVDKLNFIKKLGYCIDLVKENFGENTKWKWSFVEIEGRFSIIAKNTFDIKRFQKMDDPATEGFQERRAHLSFIQRLLSDASQGYRSKFELITKDIEDLKKAIDFQKALLRINNVIGDQDKIEKCKKQIEVWATLLEKHIQEKDNENKKKQISK